jgi:thioredoxin 1
MKTILLLMVILFSVLILPQSDSVKPKVTFVELGSDKCIPCKQMQPILKSVESKYGSQLKVVFYDVWTKEQKKYAEKYKIKLIPTQVFLDENGKEFFRHEGFFPEEEIDKLLKSKGLKINKVKS